MNKIKSLLQYQKEIIEGFFVSAVGSWALCSIIRGAYRHINDVNFGGTTNIAVVICLFVIGMALMAMLYIHKDSMAKLAMFAFVYLFVILCACQGYSVSWGDASYYNQIGNVCFQTVLCVIAVLAFMYVKEDIFNIFAKIHLTKKETWIVVAVIGVLFFAFIGVVTVYRYLTYSNSTFDFGIFAQMYEYMKQKGTISTTVERNKLLSHFAVHFSPIFYIALPIYFIFDNAITVQLIQAFMVAIPVIPIVLLCKHHKLSNQMAIAVAPVYVFILGIFFLFSKKDKKRGVILIVASAIYFAMATAIVNSYGLGIQEYRFGNLYFTQDGGLIQVFETLLANPGYAISQIIRNTNDNSMDKIGYIISMLVPVAAVLFTTGKKYSRYILLLPFIIINLLPTYLYMHDITFQYDFSVIALMMYAIILNIADMDVNRAKKLATVSVICASVMFMGSIYQKAPYYVSRYNADKATYQGLNKALDMVPEDASVCASGFLVPHLSKNLILYDQNHLESDIYTDYLVVDARYDTEKEKFSNIIASGKYEVVYNVDGLITIYKRTSN